MKIAHISDLHFSKLTLSPLQFFSKRWIGNLNLFFSRKKGHSPKQVYNILKILEKHEVECVFITGDLSTTSRASEFLLALEFIEEIRKKGIKTIVLPGNHDHYTKSAYKKKLFYSYFTNTDFPYLFKDKAVSLKNEGIEAVKLNDHYCAITLDAVVATSLVMSTGLFSEEIEKKLIDVLENIPQGLNTLVLCHFPFFCIDSYRKRLIRKEKLKTILEKYNVSIYFHGHTHNHSIANLQPELPLILDSGSCSRVKEGYFNILNLDQDKVGISVYKSHYLDWKKSKDESINLGI